MSEEAVVKRESNKMEMVKAFTYRDKYILIRKWLPNIYEFLVAINGNIYCDYYEANLSRGRGSDKKNDELINQIVLNLCNSAISTVDYHIERSSVWYKLINQFNKLIQHVKRFRKFAFKQKEPATAERGEGPTSV